VPAPLRLKGLFAFGVVALVLGYVVPTVGVASGPIGNGALAEGSFTPSTASPRPLRVSEELRVYDNHAAHFGRQIVQTSVPIPFATRQVTDGRLPAGTTAVGTPGVAGVDLKVIEESLVNGDVVQSEVLSETSTAPSDQVVLVGTAPPTPAPAPVVDLSAAPAAYARAIAGSSTAYCDVGHTATGTQAGPGSIAVDPSVIPLGSHLYIPGYGYGWAVDTGGAVIGTIVDVWMASCSDAIQWGRRKLTIYVLAS
jgi:3D (Asp-Asp-Asp) domain-containing protein